jgi:tetratricopeptide (TPR) repeat protein
MLWRERGDSDRAIADFTAAIAIDPLPRSDEAYSRRGNAIVAKRDVNVYENRALALLERSDFDGAIADFNSAINLDPNGADSFNGRGAALRAKGELDRAKADFSYAIKLDRTHMGAYYNRGLVEVAKGELDPAVADFTAALRLDSDFIDGYEARAEAFLANRARHCRPRPGNSPRPQSRARDYYLRGSIRYDRVHGFSRRGLDRERGSGTRDSGFRRRHPA